MNISLSIRKLRNRQPKNLDFLISFFLLLLSYTKLLTSIAYQLKQISSYFMHAQNNITFIVVTTARLSVNWQEQRFWLAVVLWSHKTTPFWGNKHKVKVQTCAYWACASYAFYALKISNNQESEKFSLKYKKQFSGGLSYFTSQKHGEVPLPILSPIPSLILHFINGMGVRMGSSTSCFRAF